MDNPPHNSGPEEQHDHHDQVNPLGRVPDIHTAFVPDQIASVEENGNALIFRCTNGISLELFIHRRDIVEIRYQLPHINIPKFSYAISPDFKSDFRTPVFAKRGDFYIVKTGALFLHIGPDLKIRITNTEGITLMEDKAPFRAAYSVLHGLHQIEVNHFAPEGLQYFGMGDKPGLQQLRGQYLENWNADSFGFNETSDPLYRSVPFFYTLNTDGLAYGIFLDNTYKSTFSFDHHEDHTLRMFCNGGNMNYYFMYGPSLTEVAQKYTLITGLPELPPHWALGFHQCRWSYFPDRKVREIADGFRLRKIPCDAIYLDIDYMDDFKCFTWHPGRFLSPTALIKELASKGFHTVAMIDPGIAVDESYHVFNDGIQKNVFCRRPDGSLMVGPVWPQECVFPDFTDSSVRRWWGDLYRELYIKNGISGFWNDMNEPAVLQIEHMTFPDNVLHDYDDYGGDHRKAHNIYGMQMSRATYEGLRLLKPEKRPFLLTRSTFSGGQRFASVWTGDNVASWEHLAIANRQIVRLSISGFSFAGTDIGGFADVPTGELLVRWLQLSIFHPFFRIHSMGNHYDGISIEENADDSVDQEPWSFGDPYTDLSKEAIELRYTLFPFIYDTFYRHTSLGIPMLTPLVFLDPIDKVASRRELEFVFGEKALIAPVLHPGQTQQVIYLPQGNWFNYWTNQIFTGKQFHRIGTPLTQFPFFIKAGSIIPHHPVRQHTGEKVEKLILHIYLNGDQAIEDKIYEDQGEGYGYQQGIYLKRSLRVSFVNNTLMIRQRLEGAFKPSYSKLEIQLLGSESTYQKCLIEGKEANFYKSEGVLVVNTVQNFKQIVFQ